MRAHIPFIPGAGAGPGRLRRGRAGRAPGRAGLSAEMDDSKVSPGLAAAAACLSPPVVPLPSLSSEVHASTHETPAIDTSVPWASGTPPGHLGAPGCSFLARALALAKISLPG